MFFVSTAKSILFFFKLNFFKKGIVINMKKYKRLFFAFTALGVLLSDTMCAVVAYNYCEMKNTAYSAPASVAFIFAIPFAVAITICAVIAYTFYKKSKNNQT